VSDLTDMRDHCRKQQAHCERTARALRRELARTDDYGMHSGVEKYLAKAEKDAGLWTQLADEIDNHLNTTADAPLWEMP